MRVFRIFELLFMSVLSFSPCSLAMKSYMRSDYQQAARHHLILSGWLLKTRCVQDSLSLYRASESLEWFSFSLQVRRACHLAVSRWRKVEGFPFAESSYIDGPQDIIPNRHAYKQSVTQRVSLPCSYRTCNSSSTSSKSMYVNFHISKM